MRRDILNNLDPLPFFSIAAITAFEKAKPRALHQNLQRWVRSGHLIRLKNGLYVTKTHLDRFLHDKSYLELMANKLTIPSYLSTEYVLQKNGLLTEATFGITSITRKTTRRYQNPLGAFDYRHLHPKFYFGFERRSYGRNLIYEATVAKALFDFLYLRLAGLDPAEATTLEEMRLNWSELDPSSFQALVEIIKKSGIKKMAAMIPLLKEIYGNSR
ncbi:MAG: hypothetical protein HYY44_05325 [Deltaproteobacteria bacterium]|nr:hypothetical protein [Deltaproteobacteria bacterium]